MTENSEATPQVDRLAKIKRWLEPLSFLVIILGVPTFFYQQWQSDRVQRIEHTLEFVGLFQQDRIATARADLLTPWIEYSAEIQFINASGGIPATVMRDWVDGLIASSAESDGENRLSISINTMAEFYDQIFVCVSAGVCHRQKAIDYFQSHATRFYCIYGFHVARLNRQLSLGDFGAGTVWLATGGAVDSMQDPDELEQFYASCY